MRFLSCSVLVAVLAIAGTAHADDADLARARALFDEAGARERVGDWRGAQDRLRAALRIRETPHLHYALGWALEKGDDAPGARSEYRVALDLAERANVTEVATLARARLAAIGPAEGSDDRGADPPSRQDPTPTPVATRDAPAARREETGTMLPWMLVGVGGALAVGGGALLVASTHDAATRDDATSRWCAATSCTGGTTATRPETPEAAAYRREAVDASTQGNTKQVIGVALAGVGVLSAAVGAFLLVRRGPSVTASVAPGLAAASATFRF